MTQRAYKRRRAAPTHAEIEAALVDSNGAIAVAARKIGISCSTIKAWLRGENAPPPGVDLARLREVIDQEREYVVDMVERACVKLALEGDGANQRFILGTRGKDRGYSLRTEITGADGGPIEVRTLTPTDADEIARSIYGAPGSDGDA